MIKYKCTDYKCGNTFSKFVKVASSATPTVSCPKCSKESKRKLSAPNNSSIITIDNGLQPRAVEVNPNIMELRHEKAHKEPDRGD